MQTESYTLLDKVNQAREHQKDWLVRCKEKGIDMSWKAHVVKKKPISFVPMSSHRTTNLDW